MKRRKTKNTNNNNNKNTPNEIYDIYRDEVNILARAYTNYILYNDWILLRVVKLIACEATNANVLCPKTEPYQIKIESI